MAPRPSALPCPRTMAARPKTPADDRRRRTRRVHERSRIALFDVFRQSFEEHDARKGASAIAEPDGSSTAELSSRSNARRIGVDEQTLRMHVQDHLATLMNTIRLDAAVDLDDAPNVKRSVVNYGFPDLSSLTIKELNSRDMLQTIRSALEDHEPRLVPGSLAVRMDTIEVNAQARVAVHLTADLIADPADVAVEFSADVDTGSGKVILHKSRT